MLSLEDILIFRGIADEVLRNEATEERQEQMKKVEEKNAKSWGGWMSSWFQADQPPTPEVDEEDIAKKVAERRKMEDQIASQIWADLRTAVDYKEDEEKIKNEKSAFVFPKDYVKIRGNFEIQNVSFSLNESHWGATKGLPKLTPICMGSWDSVKSSLLQRDGSLSLKASLGSVELNDYVSLPGLVVGLARSSSLKIGEGIVEVGKEKEEKGEGEGEGEAEGKREGEGEVEKGESPLFTIDFEDHPLNNDDIDYSLKISSKPIDITLTRPVLKKLGEFFTTDSMSEEEKELLAYLWKLENEKQKKVEMDKYHEKLSDVEKGKGVGEEGGGGALFEAFGEAAANQMEYARQSAQAQFQAMKLLLSQQQNKPKILLDVMIDAPNVLIPRDTQSLLARIDGGKGRKEAFPISEHDCVVLELGSISIKTLEDVEESPTPSPSFTDAPIGLPTTPLLASHPPTPPSPQDLHDFYDHFSVSVTGMRASLKDSSLCHVLNSEGHVVPLQKAPIVFGGDSVVVEKIDFFVRVDVCKLPLAHLPAIRLNLRFPFLGVVVSNFKIKKLVEIAKGWMEFGAASPQKSSTRRRKRFSRGPARASAYASFSPSALFSPALTPSPSLSPAISPSIPFLDSSTTWVTSPSSLFDLPTAHHITSTSGVTRHLSSQYFAPLSIGDNTPTSPSHYESFSYLPSVPDTRDSSSLHNFSLLRDSTMHDSGNDERVLLDSYLRNTESNMNLRDSLQFLSPKPFNSPSPPPSRGPHLPQRQPSAEKQQTFSPEEQKIELCFNLDEMRVTLLSESPEKIDSKTASSSSSSPSSSSPSQNPLIVVSLQKTNISFRQTTHQQSARVAFGSFFVEDSSLLASPSISPEYCFLCSSNPAHRPSLLQQNKQEEGEGEEGDQNAMGVIEYVGTPKTSPKYWTCVAENVISLQTSQMHINVNRPVLVNILSASNEITESLALLSSPPPSSPSSSSSPPSSLPSPMVAPSPKDKVWKRKSQHIPINKEERAKKHLKQKNVDYVNSLSSVEERLAAAGNSKGSRKSYYQGVGEKRGAPLVPHLKASAVLGSISLSLNMEKYEKKEKGGEKSQREPPTKTIKSMKRFLFSTLGGSSFKIRVGAEGETNISGTIGTISLRDLRSNAWSQIIDIKESEKLVDFSLKILSLPSLRLPRTNPSSSISSSSASFSSYSSYSSFSSFGDPRSPVVGSPLSSLVSPTDSHIHRSIKAGKIPAKKSVWGVSGSKGEGEGRYGVVGPVRVMEADVNMSSVEVVGKTELIPLINEYFEVFSSSSPSTAGGVGKGEVGGKGKEKEEEEKGQNEEGDEEEDEESSSTPPPLPALNLTKLTVKINNCFVITPLNPSSSSSPFARFDFGKISVRNSHYLHPKLVLFALPMEKMVVRVGAMKLQTCFPCLTPDISPSSPLPSEKFRGSKSIREHVLWDTDLDVTITRPMISMYGLLDIVAPEDRMSLFPPPLAVGVSIPGVEITMSDEQISFLLDVSVNLMNQMKRRTKDEGEEEMERDGEEVGAEEGGEGSNSKGDGEEVGPLSEYFVYLENFSILLNKATLPSSSSTSPILDPDNRTYEEDEMMDMELEEVLHLSMYKTRQKFAMFFFFFTFFLTFRLPLLFSHIFFFF